MRRNMKIQWITLPVLYALLLYSLALPWKMLLNNAYILGCSSATVLLKLQHYTLTHIVIPFCSCLTESFLPVTLVLVCY